MLVLAQFNENSKKQRAQRFGLPINEGKPGKLYCDILTFPRRIWKPYQALSIILTINVIGDTNADKKGIKVVPEQEAAKMKHRADRFGISNPLDPEKMKQYVFIYSYDM